MTLTVLTRVLTTEDWQTLTDSRSDHEGVGGAETILVWLSQCEVFEVETELANVVRLFDGHLAGVGSVLTLRVLWVHEGGLILVRCATAGELYEE